MVGTSNHQDSVISLQPVDFIEEVRSSKWGDDSVNVFEDEKAWSHPPSHSEHTSKVICIRGCFDIEAGDGVLPQR